MPAPKLFTDRLVLRPWHEADLLPFAKMNADPKIMQYFPSPLSTEESDALAFKIMQELEEKNYGLWAVEVKDGCPFIGFVGLHYQDFPAHFTPCIEIGWRLAYEHQGKGYAFEAASKVKEYAFETLQLEEIVSFTAEINKKSIRLMEKLGMTAQPSDRFNRHSLPEEHPLRPHVLYRLTSDSNQ